MIHSSTSIFLLFSLILASSLLARESNITNESPISPGVSILNMRETTSLDIVEVDTTHGKLIWKYDANEFVSGYDLKGLLVTMPDSLRYIQDNNSHGLRLKNDTLYWTGIENRQTRVIFNPPLPLFASLDKDKADSLTITFEGMVEYGNHNNWQCIKGHSYSRFSETGILSDGTISIPDIRCVSIETTFNTVPSDSATSSGMGNFCYTQNFWFSPSCPLPILRGCRLLRLDNDSHRERDSVLLTERYILYTPENQAYDNLIPSDSTILTREYALTPAEDNPQDFPIYINSIINTSDGIEIDANATAEGDITVTFTLFTVNGRVLAHQSSVIPKDDHLYQHFSIPAEYSGVILMNVGYGPTSCGYRFVR